MTKAINKWFLKVHNADKYILYWFKTVQKLVDTQGVDKAISDIKYMRLLVTRYLCGQPVYKADRIIGINRLGLPKMLGCLQDLILDPQPNNIRLLLTMLCISRALPGSPYNPPLNTITDDSQASPESIKEFETFLPHVWQMLALPTGINPSFNKYFMTTKSGIYTLALSSSLLEVHSLPDAIWKQIEIVGGMKLVEAMNSLKELNMESIIEYLKDSKLLSKFNSERRMRRLSIVHAPERKSRLIAIQDYWTQCALKPLSDVIFNILKGIQSDCTFNQRDVSHKFTDDDEPYYSFDLTAATDRFPISVQRMVVGMLTNDTYAKAWEGLMVDHEYDAPKGYSEEYVKYNSGQPMGAYSSWTTFTLTHHIIVAMAALKVGKPYFTNYIILGDDIVIKSTAVAESYKAMISALGVSISPMKTHVSKDTYEFAKRWYHKGVNVTGAQINAFVVSNKYYLLAQEYINLFALWNICIEVDPGAIKEIFESLGLIRRLATKAERFLLLPRTIMGPDTGAQSLRFVRSICPVVLGCFTEATDRAYQWYTMVAAECKARVLDKSLVALHGESLRVIKTLKALVRGYKGTDAQSALHAVPAVSLILLQYQELQGQIDDLRDPMVTSPEKLIFDKATMLGFSPERLFNTRRHEVVLANNATLVNTISHWTKTYDEVLAIVNTNTIDENQERALARKLFRTQVIGTVMPGYPL